MSLSDTLRNGVPRLLLRSPAHGLLSARYCLLEFRGRTSGAAYLVPVAYVVREGTLLMSTDSRWWRNLVGGRAFSVRLRGRRVPAVAERVHGQPAEAALTALVGIRGYARAAGIERIDGVVSEAALRQAATDRTVLAVTLGRST
jgi:hypothetical protein